MNEGPVDGGTPGERTQRESLIAMPPPKLKTPKRRFRALVRRVMANAYWLREELEGPGVSTVTQTVKLLTKTKKDVLPSKFRTLLYKPAEERTEEENNKIFRQIGGLKCFKKYPVQVKKKLAGCTYYTYYGPNRVLIKQGHEALALYFIIRGEVSVTITVWDPLFGEWNEKKVGLLGVGDMFGEVALLHNIERTATITTLTDTELLCIYKNDFNRVLKSTIQKQWDDIKAAMKRFTYFANFDKVAMTEACIVSKRKLYNTDQVILGDGVGNPNYSYFVINGTCKVVEKIKVEMNLRNGIPHYRRYKPPEVTESDDSASELSINKVITDDKQKEALREMYEKMKKSRDLLEAKHNLLKHPEVPQKSKEKVMNWSDNHVIPADAYAVSQGGFLPTHVETYFIQICLFRELACFGLGETMKNRRIIADTPVDCLLIPKFWLFQKNEGNLWNRTRNYLENSIPSHRDVFKAFMIRRKWLRYRKDEFNKRYFGARVIRKTGTNVHDVPYSLRTSYQDLVFERQFTYEV